MLIIYDHRMPFTITTLLSKVERLQDQNTVNASLITELYQWMKENQASESYQRSNLKAMINFAEWLYQRNPHTTFYDIVSKDLVLKYLDSKLKSQEDDPEQKCITTYNDYLNRLKIFFRWLHNYKLIDEDKRLPSTEWKTPIFMQLKHRKSKRTSPYSATEIWELEELLTVIKYEPHPRNKAALMMMFDMDARNHEVLNVKIKNVRFKQTYAEGEIPTGKTGSGPILLTTSFPCIVA